MTTIDYGPPPSRFDRVYGYLLAAIVAVSLGYFGAHVVAYLFG